MQKFENRLLGVQLRHEAGYIVIAAGNDRLFARLCETVGRPGLAAEPMFATNDERTRNAAMLQAEIESALAARSCADWLQAFEAAGVPCGPINDVAKVVSDPQTIARNMVIRVEDEVSGTLHMAGNPIKMSAFADPTERAAAPDLGRDQARILREFAD